MLALALLLAPVASANGQTAHLWITETALQHLPEGELKELLTREDLRASLRNGTMFPDGGYPLGDDYAEIAHWERFQGIYLDWIRETYAPPWEDEAARHIAFLLGMASHGMADQVHDALYLEEAKVQDASSDWATYSIDEATDVVLASEAGAQEAPEDVVPYERMVELYATYGYTVSRETLEDGQSLLRLALIAVGLMGEDAGAVEMYRGRFPWGTAHLFDDERGNPPSEAEVVAVYWQVLWKRLHGEDWTDQPVIATFPASHDEGLPLAATDYDARPAFVFARGIDGDVSEDQVTVEDASGEPVSVSPNLYYRDSSHVLLLAPNQDWIDEELYTATALPGIAFLGDQALEEPWSFTFRAGEPIVPEDTGKADTGEVKADTGCGCASARRGGTLLGLLVALLTGTLRRAPRGGGTERRCAGGSR